MNTTVARIVLGLSVVMTAAGCGAPAAPATPTSASPDPSSTPVSADIEADADGVGGAPSTLPSAAAVATVAAYVQSWARPQLDRNTWYADVKPQVTAAYGQLLADADPTHVPAHAVTGAPRPVSSTTAVLVADVPTDAGPVRVTVVNDSGRWLVATAALTAAR